MSVKSMPTSTLRVGRKVTFRYKGGHVRQGFVTASPWVPKKGYACVAIDTGELGLDSKGQRISKFFHLFHDVPGADGTTTREVALEVLQSIDHD